MATKSGRSLAGTPNMPKFPTWLIVLEALLAAAFLVRVTWFGGGTAAKIAAGSFALAATFGAISRRRTRS